VRATLPAEVAAFLHRNGPATVPEIGRGVSARDADVKRVLIEGRFERVSAPEGRSVRGAYFNSSDLVPSSEATARRGARDCEFLLSALADGEWHTLNEILGRSFRDRGVGLTVHSRAAELRRRGHKIENRTERDPIPGPGRRGFTRAVSSYRLVVRAGSPRALAGTHNESAEAA